MSTLPELERNVVALRFGIGEAQPVALRETGRRLGLSAERCVSSRTGPSGALRARKRLPRCATPKVDFPIEKSSDGRGLWVAAI